MHSAGIMAPPYIKSVDGFESSFVTNHLGPFLFINNIMGKIRAAAKGNPGGSRVVTVSSEGHALGTVGKTLQEIGFNVGLRPSSSIYGQLTRYRTAKHTTNGTLMGSPRLQIASTLCRCPTSFPRNTTSKLTPCIPVSSCQRPWATV